MVFRFFNSCNFWKIKIKIKNKKETQLDGKEKRQEKKRSTACINMMTVNLYDSMEDDILWYQKWKWCHCTSVSTLNK